MKAVTNLRAFADQNFYPANNSGIALDDSQVAMRIIDSTNVPERHAYLEERLKLTLSDGDIVPESLDSPAATSNFLQRQGVLSQRAHETSLACQPRLMRNFLMTSLVGKLVFLTEANTPIPPGGTMNLNWIT